MFPTRVRLSGMAIGTQIGFAIGGFAPTAAAAIAGGGRPAGCRWRPTCSPSSVIAAIAVATARETYQRPDGRARPARAGRQPPSARGAAGARPGERGLIVRPACRRRAGTPARSALGPGCRGPIRRRAIERRLELGVAPVAPGVGLGGDGRAIARLEVLAEVARALEGADLQHVALQRGEVDGGAEQLGRCASLPHSGGGCAPGGGGGANGPSVRRSVPIMPSGRPAQQPDRAAGTADADELVGGLPDGGARTSRRSRR